MPIAGIGQGLGLGGGTSATASGSSGGGGVTQFNLGAGETVSEIEDRTARRIDYSLIGGYLALPAETSETTVYVVGSQVPPSDYGDGTTTLPAFLERHLLAASVAEFYRSDGQLDKAMAQEGISEEYLLQELDRNERLQSQNKVLVTPYPAMWPTLLVTQTTV